MTLEITTWDAGDHINDPEYYLKDALELASETGDYRIFNQALADVSKAQKMTHIAERSGLGRTSLYKALNPESHPQFETISKVVKALGFKLAIVPA